MSVLIDFNCFDQLFLVLLPTTLPMGPPQPWVRSRWARCGGSWSPAPCSAVVQPWLCLATDLLDFSLVFLAWSHLCFTTMDFPGHHRPASLSVNCRWTWPWPANWLPGITSDLPPHDQLGWWPELPAGPLLSLGLPCPGALGLVLPPPCPF